MRISLLFQPTPGTGSFPAIERARCAALLLLGSLHAGVAVLGAQQAPPASIAGPGGATPSSRALSGSATQAQPGPTLSLAEAMREADQRAFANRLAHASSAADVARVRQTLLGILPSLRVESGVVRTTDPIGAFGTMLRQRQVTAAAFDPARLNDPAAITNVQSAVVLEMPVLNADALIGRRAATAAVDAGTANAEWTTFATRTAVARAYYGAVLAAEQIMTLQQSAGAADAARRQVSAMVQQGLVTKADALQASVRVAQVSADLIAAQNDALTAQQQLAVLLGRAGDVAPTIPLALPDDELIRALAVRDTAGTPGPRSAVEDGATSPRANSRADIRAAAAGVLAADTDRRRAMSTMLPRVNGFARYDWNTPGTLFAGQKNWTVGLMASWALFNGGGAIADVAGATAKATSARAGSDALHAQAVLERDVSRRGVIVALQRLDLATLAADQSREAHRLVEKRYGGGVAIIAELLGAEASATGAALARSSARFALITAIAIHWQAIGADPATLTSLDGTR